MRAGGGEHGCMICARDTIHYCMRDRGQKSSHHSCKKDPRDDTLFLLSMYKFFTQNIIVFPSCTAERRILEMKSMKLLVLAENGYVRVRGSACAHP